MDTISGGLYKFTRDRINGTTAQKVDWTKQHGDATLLITVVLSPDPQWQRISTLARAGR